MKKKYFTNIFLLAMLILFATSSLQAQNWFHHDIMIKHSDMESYVDAQKVRPYKDQIIIETSFEPITSNPCFTTWINDSNMVNQFFLGQIGLTVSDFTILGDTLYFCGKKLNNQNNYEGAIGKISISCLLSGNNLQYNITTIANTQNLTKLVAYYVDTNYVRVIAIGDNGVSNLTPGRIVMLNDSIGSANFTPNVKTTPLITNTTREIFHDMCLLDNYVVTLSHVYPSNQYIVRYFKRSNQLHNPYSYIYTLPNITFNTMSEPYGYALHISEIAQDTLAVAVSASRGVKYFTIINLLKQLSPVVYSSQAVMHENKDHKVLEMEYSYAIRKLLILHSNYFENEGQLQTLCRISPIYTPSDTLYRELLSTKNSLNHFALFLDKKCALVGVNKRGSVSGKQLLSIRNMELSNGIGCYKAMIEKVIGLNFPNGVSLPELQQIPNLPTTWSVYYGSDSYFNVYIDCYD